ncbi:hypothetical protein B0H13DRAFT_1883815 [Mycena leptocephala]|nr:hypothetical protein B0H13DRAFT_1883815 [Mycena leptocephala]
MSGRESKYVNPYSAFLQVPDEQALLRRTTGYQHWGHYSLLGIGLAQELVSSLILGPIVTIIFTITFGGPVTENEVFAGAGDQDAVGISEVQTPVKNTEKDCHIFYIDLDLWQMTVSGRLAGCGRYFGRTELSYAGQNDGTIEIKTAIQKLRKWVFGALETKTPEGVDLKVEVYSGEGPWKMPSDIRQEKFLGMRRCTEVNAQTICGETRQQDLAECCGRN